MNPMKRLVRNCFAVIGPTSAISKTKSNKIQSTPDSALGAFIYLQLILLPAFTGLIKHRIEHHMLQLYLTSVYSLAHSQQLSESLVNQFS